MDLVNFNDYRQNQRMYGGTAGRKMGIGSKIYTQFEELSGECQFGSHM